MEGWRGRGETPRSRPVMHYQRPLRVGGGGRQSRGTVPIAFQQRLQAARDSLGVRVRPRKKTEGGDIAATREGSGVLGRAGL